MKNLIVNGEFKETSYDTHTFMSMLLNTFNEKDYDYFYIRLIDDYTRNTFEYEHRPILNRLIKWVLSIKSLDDNTTKELKEKFDDNISSFMEGHIKGARKERLLDDAIEYLIETINYMPYRKEVIQLNKFTESKDYSISPISENYSLTVKILKNDKNANLKDIKTMFQEFANGTGTFTITSVIDNETTNELDIDDIFECPSFETECFGDYSGYDEIASYLDEQCSADMCINELHVNYIRNR